MLACLHDSAYREPIVVILILVNLGSDAVSFPAQLELLGLKSRGLQKEEIVFTKTNAPKSKVKHYPISILETKNKTISEWGSLKTLDLERIICPFFPTHITLLHKVVDERVIVQTPQRQSHYT